MKTTAALIFCLSSMLMLSACSNNQTSTTTDKCPSAAEIKQSETSTINGWQLYVHNKKTVTADPNILSARLATPMQFLWLKKHVKNIALAHWAPDTTRFPTTAVCAYIGGDKGNDVFFYGKNIKLKPNPDSKYWRKDQDLTDYPNMYLCWPAKNDPTKDITNCYF